MTGLLTLAARRISVFCGILSTGKWSLTLWISWWHPEWIVLQNKCRLNACPPWVQPALLPLTITKDKSTDIWAVGTLTWAWQLVWHRTYSIQNCTVISPPLLSVSVYTVSPSLCPLLPALAVCHIYWLHSNCNLHELLATLLRKSCVPVMSWRLASEDQQTSLSVPWKTTWP